MTKVSKLDTTGIIKEKTTEDTTNTINGQAKENISNILGTILKVLISLIHTWGGDERWNMGRIKEHIKSNHGCRLIPVLGTVFQAIVMQSHRHTRHSLNHTTSI